MKSNKNYFPSTNRDSRALVIKPCGLSYHGFIVSGTAVASLVNRGMTVVTTDLSSAPSVLNGDPHFGEIFMFTRTLSSEHQYVIDLLSRQKRFDRLMIIPSSDTLT